jgi:hypothetical protein
MTDWLGDRRLAGFAIRVLEKIGGQTGQREAVVDRRGEHWTESEYETLFGRFPAKGQRPSDADVDGLAIELGRTADALSWQWSDGAAYVSGRSASTTSDVLKTWLDNRR